MAMRSDRRQELWAAASSIGQRFPSSGAFALELSFRDPEGKLKPSPFRQLYLPSMQAYFDLRCPLNDCRGGGFDLQTAICGFLADRRTPRSGVRICAGTRPGIQDYRPCQLELSYRIATGDDATA